MNVSGRGSSVAGADCHNGSIVDWPRIRLADLMHRHNEIIHPGDRSTGTAVFVGLEHVEAGTGQRIGSATVDFAQMSGRKPTFKTGQIVYGYLRPYLNKVWIAEFDGCSSVDQFAFEVNSKIAHTPFIAAFLRSETFLRRAVHATTPGQLPRISIDQVLAVELNLPPLPEQERIAGRLSEQLAAVERARAASQSRLAAAESLQAAYLRRVFEGPEASGWETVPFGALANLVNGRAFAQHELLEEGTPVIRIQNLNGGERWYYSNLDLEEAKYCRDGDLLFAWSATFGPYWWRGPKAIFHYHIWRVENGPNLDRDFAFYLLQWITEAVRGAGQGVAMLHMTKGGMEEWPVAIPPIAEQRRLAATLSRRLATGGGVSRLADGIRAELAAIQALPAALLRAAFEGND